MLEVIKKIFNNDKKEESKMEIMANDTTFKKEVIESDVPVLVDFWASWCYPCRMVAPSVSKIAETYQGKVKVVKVDVDQAQSTALQYGIRSIPTLAVFKNGKVVDSMVGAMPYAVIEQRLTSHM